MIGQQIQDFAELVHESCNPLILVESNPREMTNILKFSHFLEPSIPFLLITKEDISPESLQASDVILEINNSSSSQKIHCRGHVGDLFAFPNS